MEGRSWKQSSYQLHPVAGLHMCAHVCVRVHVSLITYMCIEAGPHHGLGNITQPQRAEQGEGQAGAWCSCAKLAAKMEIPQNVLGKGLSQQL